MHRAFGETDVGKKRDHNEDSYIIDDGLNLYVVADGMGGHAAGEVASATAIRIIRQEITASRELIQSYQLDAPDDLRDRILRLLELAVQKACAAIYKMGEEEKHQRGMGTTLSLMLLADNGGFIAHVGDSRIYLLREGEIHQLTVDHTLINEHLKRGTITKEEARKAKYKNVITRAVGIQEQVRVDTLHLDVLPSDRFIICSDGLHGYLRQGDIEQVLEAGPIEQMPNRLIDLANERGGKDNITVIFIEVADDEAGAAAELRQRMETMRNAPLFKYLTYRELVNLMNLTYVRSFADGETIIEEGVPGDELFLLVRGQARVIKGSQEIAALPQGSHFGEMALFDNAPRSASIKAIGSTRLLVIGRKQFYNYIRKDTAAGIKLLWSFLQILTLRLRTTDERLKEAQQELSIQEVEPDWILPDD
ncbi:MAG: Stp1/IreP family PP2C-type Ser/Thr phosphatase [Deltaproteobacteria bacterium]|nr:Stp1/IreP family PP2C-type Ser/Thr phosphatase [Deltaproteobacteria bacterium]